MGTTVGFDVSYGQFAVFASALRQPFNDWTDQHVNQGFAWRPGSVSFRCMVESGKHSVEMDVVNHLGGIHPDAERVLEVPFEVPADGALEIGSIADTVPISVPPGSYLLRCEFMTSNSASSTRREVRLTFAKHDAPHFAVVRADPELRVESALLTNAQPAG